MEPKVISKRRQVASDQDRYGGYRSDITAGRPDALTDDLYAEFRLSRAERGLVGPEYGSGVAYGYTEAPQTDFLRPAQKDKDTPDADPVAFSKRERPTEYVGIDIPAPPKRRGADEVMPAIKPRPFEPKADRASASGLSPSVKTMLAVYIAAVVVLAVVVIATGIAITSAQSRITNLERDLENRLQTVSDLEAGLYRLSDPAEIASRAESNDMERIDSYREVSLIDVYEPPSYKADTNAFDKFCDWLSGLFG
ncbi:MAG: hypothetical protein FWD58_08790 [Firmicutes bacterium]|nr:hypothetical protein [Bacillota bacterium]